MFNDVEFKSVTFNEIAGDESTSHLVVLDIEERETDGKKDRKQKKDRQESWKERKHRETIRNTERRGIQQNYK